MLHSHAQESTEVFLSMKDLQPAHSTAQTALQQS